MSTVNGQQQSYVQSARAPGRRGLHQNVGTAERIGSVAVAGALLWLGFGGTWLRKAAIGAISSALAYRGLTGHCATYAMLDVNTNGARSAEPEPVRRSVTVGMSREEAFARWSDPQTLSVVLSPFAEISASPQDGMHLRVPGALGTNLGWDLQVVETWPGDLIRFRTLPSAKLWSEWTLTFRPALREDLGTEITLEARFDVPDVGRGLTKLLGMAPRLLAARALGNFKSLVETGEIPTTGDNPAARSTVRLSSANLKQIHA